jgi:radical SAM protein with 4Fe4S-binding SPASM domain
MMSRGKDMELPKFVQIEPVGQCNLRCRMCSIQFRTDGPPHGPLAFMDLELFKQLVDQFAGAEELHLQGLGEPLMHPRFCEMVQYAKARGMRVSTNSNMTILNQRRAEELVRSGLDCLHVSIDGATPEVYEKIRVRARLAHVIRNLELLLSAKRGLKSETPNLIMVVVIMQENLHQLPELVRFSHRFGFQSVFVQHLCHDYGEAGLPERYLPMRDFVGTQTLLGGDPTRIKRYFSEAREVAHDLKIELRLPHTQPRARAPGTPGPQRCDWPWRGAYLSYQGLAMPCCMISTPDRFNFGSMAEKGVEQVWSGDEYEDFRRRLSSDDPPDICRSCSVYLGTF